jgi:dihydroneopterin aldolase/2-amino-4-hydroxy-6-hydroxymethyldihydropteridine diphosphokinase
MNTKVTNVFIGVGSNIDPEQNIADAISRLSMHVDITGISTFYWNKPLFGMDQDDYLNGVWRIRTSDSPKNIKQNVLNNVEQELCRNRTHDRNAPRTVDLDLLLFGDLVVTKNGLTLPDPDIYTRSFVAFPLSELDPDLVIPDTDMHISAVLGPMSMNGLSPNIPFTKQLRGSYCNHHIL